MSSHEVITSYVRSWWDEIGGFWIISFVGAFSCFMEYFFHCLQHNWCLLNIWAICSCHKDKVRQGHACQGPISWLIPAVTILNLYLSFASRSLFRNKTNVKIEISAYEYTIYDPLCVEVMQGHPSSYEVTNLRWLRMVCFLGVKSGVFWMF